MWEIFLYRMEFYGMRYCSLILSSSVEKWKRVVGNDVYIHKILWNFPLDFRVGKSNNDDGRDPRP